MRPLTLDLDLLAAALDSRERGTHFLDLESGALRLLDPDDLSLEEREELEDPERYLPLPRLTQDDRLELREAFLHQLRHPHAQPLLRAALESRRPIACAWARPRSDSAPSRIPNSAFSGSPCRTR